MALPSRLVHLSANISLVREGYLFTADDERDCAACPIVVKGRGIGSRARLVATVGESVAECELMVRSSGASGIQVEFGEFDINQRAYMSEDGTVLYVNARDKSVARYLGSKAKNWPGQNELHFRTMLAEIVAFTVSRFVIEQRRQELQMASELFRAQMRLMESWLPRLHAVMVTAGELPR